VHAVQSKIPLTESDIPALIDKWKSEYNDIFGDIVRDHPQFWSFS
jgi:hypothetical protein